MRGFIPFPRVFCPKVNVIARLEFELAHYDSAVQRFSHYTTRTPPNKVGWLVLVGYLVTSHWYWELLNNIAKFGPLLILPTPRCSSYWKRTLLVALDYGHKLINSPNQLVITIIYISNIQVFNLFSIHK